MTDRADVERADDAECRTADHERRAMCQMLFHWLDRHVDGRLPKAAELCLDERPDLLDHAFVLDLATRPGNLLVAEAGPVIRSLCGGDPVGHCAKEVFPAPFREQVPHLCENLTSFGKPISDSGVGFRDGSEFAYRAILIPLGDGTPEHVIERALGSMTFRWMP